jgi:hypothetical protein
MYRKLGGPQSRSGHGGEEKNSIPRRELNPDHPGLAQRYTAELSQLLITGDERYIFTD